MGMNRIQPLLAIVLGLAFCGTSVVQSALKTDTDLSGMTDAYLTQIEQQDLSARHAEIAAIHTGSQVRERQIYIEKTLLRELGGFPEKLRSIPR
jgi:hypothetical protein